MFELFAAIKGKTKLICQYQGGYACQVVPQLNKTPVDAAKAECSQKKDKKMIDAYIINLLGSFEKFKVMLKN